MFRVFAALCCAISSSIAFAEKPLQVVTSIQPLALIAKTLLPADTEYRVLVPQGANPHSYALKVSDRKALASADLVLWIGPEMERFLTKVVDQVPGTTIAMNELLGDGSQEQHAQVQKETLEPHSSHLQHDHSHVHGSRDMDMHLWLNPDHAVLLVEAIGHHLQLDSVQAVASIEAIELDVGERLQTVKFMKYAVYHDAYNHFIDRFDLPAPVVVSPAGEQRPGAKHLLNVRKNLQGGQCLLVAPGQDNSLSHQLSSATGIGLVSIEPLAATSYRRLLTTMADAFVACYQR